VLVVRNLDGQQLAYVYFEQTQTDLLRCPLLAHSGHWPPDQFSG
jgi:hypothetical protein